ncbi:hypothetical protein UZ36_02695 [Candidatus Nitromaritima sp. SCGC AAA799-C22]|nr:hypothetical protein UZ36_02695 [Candidatus Nitromaritima sp. SCGC AAA799-C22]
MYNIADGGVSRGGVVFSLFPGSKLRFLPIIISACQRLLKRPRIPGRFESMSSSIACPSNLREKKDLKDRAAVWWLATALAGSLVTGWGLEPAWAKASGDEATGQLFVVQLNSFKQKANADEFVRSVKTRGYTPFVEAEGKGTVWYKVRVGPYPTRREAGEVARSLRENHGWPAIVLSVPGKRKNEPVRVAANPGTGRQSAPPDSGDSVDIVMSYFLVWLKAWQEKNTDTYFSFYSRKLESVDRSFNEWRASRLKTFQKSGRININVSEVRMKKGNDRIELSFVQEYKSDILSDVGRKQLIWKREGSRWRIVRELWKPIS